MNRYRLLALVLAPLTVIVSAPPASAQNSAPACTPVAITSQVLVTLRAGSTRRGLLLCMGERETRLALEGRIDSYPLVEIRRVVKPRDRVWDGFLKGAAIPLIAWVAFCPGCEGGHVLPRVMLEYGSLGLAIDAMHGGTRELYRAAAMR